MVIYLNIKKDLICLSIVAIVAFCALNVATASEDKYSTTFHNSARHSGDHLPMARDTTPNGQLKWGYMAGG
ncbi:MAG TPA: hypothetical protein VED16_02795 [Candidatus Acidoferrum sp.]|nr:hypothetical protein [Candidatus Acidoferrum sp.]